MQMLTTLSPNRFLAWISLCGIIFFIAWYDTTHAHLFSTAVNEWNLQNLYVSPTTETTNKLQLLYRESAEAITGLGSDIIFLLVMGMIYLYLLLRRQIKPILYCTLAVILIFGLTVLCKHLIYSPRPMFPLEVDSFPSGHTVRVAIWCGTIILLNHLHIFKLSKYWQNVLLVIPVLVAFSRIALGFHWVSDVIASLALSTGGFLFVYYLAVRSMKEK